VIFLGGLTEWFNPSGGTGESLSHYRADSGNAPAARAVRQIQAAGKTVRPGQRVRFLLTLREPGVRAWDVPEQPDLRCIDVKRYRVLIERAVQTILDPIQQLCRRRRGQRMPLSFPCKKSRAGG